MTQNETLAAMARHLAAAGDFATPAYIRELAAAFDLDPHDLRRAYLALLQRRDAA